MGKEERYFMGIDVGTYESKGVLIDKDCRILCQASQKHGLENPRPGWYEHDAEAVWWGDVCKISRLLLERSRLDPAQIECVGLSALGCDCVPVDEHCLIFFNSKTDRALRYRQISNRLLRAIV